MGVRRGEEDLGAKWLLEGDGHASDAVPVPGGPEDHVAGKQKG